MANISQKSSGSTSCTLSTDVSLVVITTAGVYELHVDTNPLVDGETLLLIVIEKVLTGSTAREVDRMTIAQNAQGSPIIVDRPRSCLFSLEYKLRQEGGTARTIDWSVTQLSPLV